MKNDCLLFNSFVKILLIMFCTVTVSIIPVYSQNFVNGDFETSTTCNKTICNDYEISCIDNWYAYGGNSSDFAWWYYGCYADVSECEDVGNRGLYLQTGIFSDLETYDNTLQAATENPYYNQNPNAIYKIEFDFIPLPNHHNATDYLTVSGATSLSTGRTPLESTQEEVIGCERKVLYFDHGQINEKSRITSFPYLVFSVESTPVRSVGAAQAVRGIMDNVSMCKVLEINLTNDCILTCISLDVNESCLQEACGTDCSVQLEAFKDLNTGSVTFFNHDESESLSDINECFEVSSEYDDIDIVFATTNLTFPNALHLWSNHEISTCEDFDVETSTTWNGSNHPPYDHFNILTIKDGVTLTIEDDVTVHFCEEGKLVIEPNARLNLYGTLTSDCGNGWKGVEVQGNNTVDQFIHSGVYAQGRIYCYPDSRIENSLIAVRLYGPASQNTGGQIFADGANFLNNRRGIEFGRYDNSFHGKPRDYISSIRNCNFDIDENYILSQHFTDHIKMYRVTGINIMGTTFGNHMPIEDAIKPKQFGIGIYAIDSKFSVGPTAMEIEDEPCLPPCLEYIKSTFNGLGIGIAAGRLGPNRFFNVYNSEFNNCFIGIQNLGVSNFSVLFNEFNMGTVAELDGEEDQIGAAYSGYMMGLTTEENIFSSNDEGNIDHSLGICTQQLGDIDNVIRRNTFSKLTVGNEAFGYSSNPDDKPIRGLYYLCNTNENNILNDFFLPDDSPADYIREVQGQFTTNTILATGNVFSDEGGSFEGRFDNFSDLINIFYYYDASYANQNPSTSSDGVTSVDADANSCIAKFCLAPCLPREKLDDEMDIYYSNLLEREDAIGNEDINLASYYQEQIDSTLTLIISFMEADTSTTSHDSLRAWYHRTESITGDLLLSGDYLGNDDYTNALRILDSIPFWHALSAAQTLDVIRVKRAYTILSSRTPDSFTSTDIDSLILFSNGIGAASTIARSILAITDSIFTSRYYLPGEINPRSENQLLTNKTSELGLLVYPNPVSDILTIDFSRGFDSRAEMQFLDINGKIIGKFQLIRGINKINMRDIIQNVSGVYIYRIKLENGKNIVGKIIYTN